MQHKKIKTTEEKSADFYKIVEVGDLVLSDPFE